jgi:hypothetical protein
MYFNVISGNPTLILPVSVAFDNAGTVVNDASYVADIMGTNLVTELLINKAIRSGVKTYVNDTYSLSISDTDIILIGSAVTIPLL